jgi:serine-type D-Ala-D-Ala carboxypeptidase (penicillin-binding protein 5/6)
VAITQRPGAKDGPGRRDPPGRRPRTAVTGALVLVLIAVALSLRIATENMPPPTIRRTLAAYVRLPGRAPALRWPREGQAAVEVQGVGSFGSSGSSAPVPIASVAKVMTVYVTLREHPLSAGQAGFAMTVTAAQVAEQRQRLAAGQSTLPVRAGERISERQALQALLLPSANNIAAMLAVHDAGRMATFVARMNATARALGMSSTTYTDPSGYDTTTVSTAADQLRLARAAMHMPAFAAIVDERSAELPVAGTVQNLDALLGEDGYVGVKTGSDRAAGGCFMFAKDITVAKRPLAVLGVVLGQHEGSLIGAALTSARLLGDSAAAAVQLLIVLPAGTPVLTATSADGRHAAVVTDGALRGLGWGGLTLPIKVAPVGMASSRLRVGQRLATITVGGVGGPSSAAVARQSLGGPSLGWRLAHLL